MTQIGEPVREFTVEPVPEPVKEPVQVPLPEKEVPVG